MIINRFSLALIISSILSLHCASTDSLSNVEKAKLDLPLLHLIDGTPGDENQLDVLKRPDGIKEYAVIVKSDNPEPLRALGINISSVFADVIVVHVTLDELKKIVSLPTVQSIRTGSKKTIQQHN